MAHALLEQDLKVLPLDGRRVLELVNHDVLQPGTDFLEDEGRVALVDERVQQLLGVAEQKAVGLVVQLAHLLLNAAQQAQLVQVAQGQVGRLEQAPLMGALLDGAAQQWLQYRFSQHDDGVAAWVGLVAPLLGALGTVGHALADDALVERAGLQFQEETGHA